MDVLQDVLLEENEIIPAVVNVVLDLADPLFNVYPQIRAPVVKNENYYENIIPRYTDFQFRDHFRMSRATFEQLVITIGAVRANHEDRTIPLQKKVMFTVWMLSKQESFLAAGDRFGLSKSSAHKVFIEGSVDIVSTSHQYIVWPNMHSHIQTSAVFQARSRGIPGVVGVIDGCHIPIKQPVHNAVDFYNRKGFHSIVLQGVCNHRGIFIDTTIGRPGRMHDARVFRLSELYAALIGQNPLLPLNFHLIGDTAYPLMMFLMKPYQDNGHLTPQQINYNVKLSSIKSIIERAFGILKCKWRRLKFLDVKNSQTANRVILAACVLHNFLLLAENPQDGYNMDDINRIDDPDNEGVGPEINGEAEVKRTNITRLCAERIN